jgi:acetyl-CoA acetyltransferase
MAEVHDCFSITEAVLMEDLGFSAEGRVIHDVLDGVFDRDGALPVQPDGGLKCFGHPIGASGLRMVYEIWLQIHGRAGAAPAAAHGPGPDAEPGRPPAPERVRRLHRRPPGRMI